MSKDIASDSTCGDLSQWPPLARELGMQFFQLQIPNRTILLMNINVKMINTDKLSSAAFKKTIYPNHVGLTEG